MCRGGGGGVVRFIRPGAGSARLAHRYRERRLRHVESGDRLLQLQLGGGALRAQSREPAHERPRVVAVIRLSKLRCDEIDSRSTTPSCFRHRNQSEGAADGASCRRPRQRRVWIVGEVCSVRSVAVRLAGRRCANYERCEKDVRLFRTTGSARLNGDLDYPRRLDTLVAESRGLSRYGRNPRDREEHDGCPQKRDAGGFESIGSHRPENGKRSARGFTGAAARPSRRKCREVNWIRSTCVCTPTSRFKFFLLGSVKDLSTAMKPQVSEPRNRPVRIPGHGESAAVRPIRDAPDWTVGSDLVAMTCGVPSLSGGDAHANCKRPTRTTENSLVRATPAKPR